jgi:hypothetical protein
MKCSRCVYRATSIATSRNLKELPDTPIIVPILVKEYLTKLQAEKIIAEKQGNTASCELMTDARQAEVTR